MEIRWRNIIALGMVITILVLVVRYGPQMAGFLATMKNIGPGNSPEDKTLGLLAFGLVAVLIVAVVRILTQADRNRHNP